MKSLYSLEAYCGSDPLNLIQVAGDNDLRHLSVGLGTVPLSTGGTTRTACLLVLKNEQPVLVLLVVPTYVRLTVTLQCSMETHLFALRV